MAYVYLLLSLKDGKQYIGSSGDLKKRLEKHNKGYVISTKHRRPFILKGYQEFETIQEAVYYEKKYKRSHDSLRRAIEKGQFALVKNGV